MFSVNYIFLLNITYVFAIITCLGFLVCVALDRNFGPECNTLLLGLIPACPHRQFHTLPGLLDIWAAQSNSYPNTCMPSREAVCTIFMKVLGMTQTGCEPATYGKRGGHPKPTQHYHKCWGSTTKIKINVSHTDRLCCTLIFVVYFLELYQYYKIND